MAAPLTITRIEAVDVRFPTARDHDGSDAMNPDPDYSAAYLVLHTEDAGAPGPRVRLHHRRGHGHLRGRHPDPWRAHRGRPDRGRVRGHGRVLPAAIGHQPPALAGSREGRHPPRHVRRAQRGLGPVRPRLGAAPLATGRGHDPGAAGRAGRLPLPDRRADPGPGAGHPAGRRAGQGPSASRSSSATGYPAYTTSAGWLGYDDEKVRRLLPGGARRWVRRTSSSRSGRSVADDLRRTRSRGRSSDPIGS